MKRSMRWRDAGLLLLAMLVSLNAHSALINRGGGMVYDDVLNITWLQDANYMQTIGFDADGRVNNAQAKTWVENLVFGGYDDWRLPSIAPLNGTSYDSGFSFDGTTDRGFHNYGTNNELGYMFGVNLNNTSFYSPGGIGNQPDSFTFHSSFIDGESGIEYAFENIRDTYWMDPPNNPFNNAAWGFHFQNLNGVATGEAQLHGLFSPLSVWAVRNGDVASTLVVNVDPPPDSPISGGGSSAIPEPGILSLLFFGLSGFLAIRRQNRV